MSDNNYQKQFADNLQALREYKKLTKTQAVAVFKGPPYRVCNLTLSEGSRKEILIKSRS